MFCEVVSRGLERTALSSRVYSTPDNRVASVKQRVADGGRKFRPRVEKTLSRNMASHP